MEKEAAPFNNTHEHSNTTADTTEFTWEDSDEEEDGFLKRVMEASQFSKTHSDELTELYASNQPAYEVKLDEMATDIALQDEEFNKNIAKIKALRTKNQGKSPEAQAIIQRQNELISMYQRFIISEANLPDETRYAQMISAKQHIAEILHEARGETYTPLEALETLNFYTVDEETEKKIYRFPEEIFPESVTEKWNIYLASVCRHAQAASKVDVTNPDTKEQAITLDRQRRYAHLSATADVHELLNLNENDPSWTFDSTKNLLANIRDSVFPNSTSAISPAAEEFVRAHSKGLNTCDSLSSRTSR